MPRRPSFAFTMGAFVLLTASATHASPSPVALRVSGAPDCMNASTLARAIDGLLGRAAVADSPTTSLSKVDVVLTRHTAPDEFRAVLTLATADGRVTGTRELVRAGPSCAVLDGPLVVVAALLVDAAEESVRLTLPPVPPPAPPSPPPATLSSHEAWRVDTDVGASLLLGLTPPAVGARVGMRVTPPRFVPLLIRAEGFPLAETAHAGANGTFLTMAGTVAACPERVVGRAVASACLGVFAGLVHASGRDVPLPGDSDAPIVMGLAELGARIRAFGPVALDASLAVAAGQRPPNWHVEGSSGSTVVVWTPWPVAVVASVGLSLETASENYLPARH